MNPGGVCPQMACPQMACPHQDPENEKREAYLRFWTDLNSAEPSRHEVEVRRVNVKAGQCCSCVEEEVEAVVEVGQPGAALQFASDHEQNLGYLLQSDYFAWAYARAAIHAEQPDLAREVVSAISTQRPPDWEPPGPIADLVRYLSNPDASSQLP